MFIEGQAMWKVFSNAMNGELLQLLIKTHLGVHTAPNAVCSPLGGAQDSKDEP